MRIDQTPAGVIAVAKSLKTKIGDLELRCKGRRDSSGAYAEILFTGGGVQHIYPTSGTVEGLWRHWLGYCGQVAAGLGEPAPRRDVPLSSYMTLLVGASRFGAAADRPYPMAQIMAPPITPHATIQEMAAPIFAERGYRGVAGENVKVAWAHGVYDGEGGL